MGRPRQSSITPYSRTLDLPKFIKGVDVSDPLRTFTSEEYAKLPAWAKKKIWEKRNSSRNNNQRNINNNRSVSTTSITDFSEAIARGVMAATSTIASNKTNEDISLGTDEGRRLDTRGNVTSGNPTKVSFGRNAYRNTSLSDSQERKLSAIVTKARRVGSVNLSVDISKDYNTGTVANIEIDNHADTCCLGSNFRPTFITDQVCEVHPYHTSYDAIKNVQVVSGCTAYDDLSSGRTFILTIHQTL